jgi:TetR/AcrR family transcriptional repressor of nem operon
VARPIQYNPEEVIEKAMLAFWDKGYHATSLADLIEVTGLKPGSIYAAFESKEAFFMTALDHYGKQGAAAVQRMLIESPSHMQGVRRFVHAISEDSIDPESKRSCFLVNTVIELARQNEAARKTARCHLEAIEEHIRHALELAREEGEISSEADPETVAAFIMCSVWGMRVLGGLLPSSEKMGLVTDYLLETIG